MKMRVLKNQAGFTLIEMLIVVILIGILAMVIIPQISVSTEDAKVSTLKADLGAMRNAVELYYHQHKEIYPGANDSGTGAAVASAAAAATSFVAQLTQYTNEDGQVQVSKDATFKFGPYIKGNVLPTNPCNDLNTVLCDIAIDDITARVSDETTGWKFYTINGVFMANCCTAHDDEL